MRLFGPAFALALGGFLLATPLSAQQAPAPDDEGVSHAARPTRTIPLARGPFDVYDLPPSGAAAGLPAKALIVFASDAAGWTYWEDKVGRHLARAGYYVLGIDSEAYAASDYNQETLASDFERIAEEAPAALVPPETPVFFGGYGMGAAQAVAAAALPPRPPRLAGLLLVDLRQRGRYGVGLLDAFLAPRGAGTFALADLAPNLGPLRVAQLHAQHGWFSSTRWLSAVPGPHDQFDYPQSWRQFRQANKTFLKALDGGLAWLVMPPDSGG